MSFIERIVNDLLDRKIDLANTHIILPGKRPIIFFKKAFKEKEYNGFLPQFSTIEDFVTTYSGLNKIENIPLWLEAYQVQKQYINLEEKLEDFLKWIPTLLKDFNDIDLFSDNSLKVLEHLVSIERIENWGETLDSKNSEKLYYKNIKFWESNILLYQKLSKSLYDKNLGTSGMLITSALEKLKEVTLSEEDQFVFAGFNALTYKEEKFIKHFIAQGKAVLYWDTDEYYMKNKNQEAGDFLRKYTQWNYYANREFNWIGNKFSKRKNINIISVSQDVAQAKYMSNILKNIPEDELQATAVVLCDEAILPAVISSIPRNVTQVNITMGYPLKNSMVASFFKQVFQLHVFKEKNNTEGFYYQDVFNVLQHSLVSSSKLLKDFIEEIKEKNLVFISNLLIYNRLSSWDMFFIFKNYTTPIELLDQLNIFSIEEFWKTNEAEPINRENYLRFKNLFSLLINQLNQTKTNAITSFSLLQTLYQHILTNEKIDFIGEPLAGIQIMGVLETRLLSFKNVIMLGVNEGIIPAGKIENSFIPFDVKKAYNINTFLENDAVFAYHFYRLLQDADSITLIYNNLAEGLNSGEKSRFISQLEFESKHELNNRTGSYPGSLGKKEPIIIEKSSKLLEEIKKWLKSPISPTHLTNYHYNPLNFYLQNILGLKENNELEEEISPLSYGNLIHHTLESLYAPLAGNKLAEKDLKGLLNIYPFKLNEYIEKELNPDLFKQGQNYVQKLLAEKTIEKIILRDLTDVKQGNQIFLKEIEKRVSSSVLIDSIGTLKLKGFIDRWDTFNGQDRIIDYKTSLVNSLRFKQSKLEMIKDESYFKFFIQLVFYAYMMLHEKLVPSVQVGIWSFKKPSKGWESLTIEDTNTFNYTETIELFKIVTTLIEEIADPEIPFKEKVK